MRLQNRWAKQMGEMPTFTGAQAARQKHNFHTELFWGVNQGFPQHQKPFHTDHTPQVCQTKYYEVTIQVKHLCPLPHSLLSHLLVQRRAHILGTPLSPPTIGDQEGYCLHLIEYTYGVFCVKWGQQPVSGECIINVLTHYLVACYVWQPCLFLCNKHEFCWQGRNKLKFRIWKSDMYSIWQK